MVSSFGISALEAIKKIKGFENAVIAGGFIRDHVLGLEFKDVDIFVPCPNINVFLQAFFDASEPKKIEVIDDNKVYLQGTSLTGTATTYTSAYTFLPKALGGTGTILKKSKAPMDVKDIKFDKFSNWKFEMSGKGGYMKDKLYLGKMKGKYADVLDVEVMCYNLPDNEDFGKKLVKNFSYNIDMIYFDGVDIRQTKEFQNDRNYGFATLSRLDTLDELPGAMAKFFRFKEKAPNFIWKCSLLELKADKKKEEKDKKLKFKTIQEGDIIPEGARLVIEEEFPAWDQEEGQAFFDRELERVEGELRLRPIEEPIQFNR